MVFDRYSGILDERQMQEGRLSAVKQTLDRNLSARNQIEQVCMSYWVLSRDSGTL